MNLPHTSVPNSLYTEGGKVQVGHGLYIVRKADAHLFECCMRSQIAYVLHTRQVGKSSLVANVSRALQERGVSTALVDLTGLGTVCEPDQWYLGLLEEIADQLDLDTDVIDWWDENQHLGMTHRLRRFFSQIVVKERSGKVIVFLDEIDTTLALPFTDDFFAAIRELYNSRDNEPDLARLSFVIAGSASPNDLMKDHSRTPFNVGHRIELEDFTLQEAMPLAAGFGRDQAVQQLFMGHVLFWTGGHPYLTQVLCAGITRAGARIQSLGDIDTLVKETFMSTTADQERNLHFVTDMMLDRSRKLGVNNVLLKYQNILQKHIVWDQGQSPVISHLKLAGIIKVKADALVVRNEIYRRVFDAKWVTRHLTFSWRALGAAIVRRAGPGLAIASAAFIWAAYVGAKNQDKEAHLRRWEARIKDTEIVREQNSRLQAQLEIQRTKTRRTSEYLQKLQRQTQELVFIAHPGRGCDARVKTLHTRLDAIGRGIEGAALESDE